MGEKVQRMPAAEASTAATRAPRSTISGSKVAACPSGMGNTVWKPWMTSRLTMTGMPRRLCSTAAFCTMFISSGLTQFRMEPTWPAAAASARLAPPESWFIWPIFSWRVIWASRRSTLRSMSLFWVHPAATARTAAPRPSVFSILFIVFSVYLFFWNTLT